MQGKIEQLDEKHTESLVLALTGGPDAEELDLHLEDMDPEKQRDLAIIELAGAAAHEINNPLAVTVWRRHASTGGRLGKDEQKNAIAEALRRPGWKIGDEKTEMHNIIVAAMPYLKETRFRWVLDYFACLRKLVRMHTRFLSTL